MKKEDGELGALGKLREGLPGIGHDSFQEWETILYKLWEKLREHTQDLQSTVQDQLRLTITPADNSRNARKKNPQNTCFSKILGFLGS